MTLSKAERFKMDTIIEICFFGSLLLPPIVFSYLLFRFRKLSIFRRISVSGLFACSVFATLMISAVSVFIRDGLGPDAGAESDGFDALVNCWDGIVLAVLMGAILAAFAIILVTYKEKNARRSGLKKVVWLCLVMGGSWIFCQARVDFVNRSLLKPKVFSTTEPRWLFDSGCRFGFDAREALTLSNWISAHQIGWEFGSSDDINSKLVQFSADNYCIQTDLKKIVMQYYKNEADLTNDPRDSSIMIERPLVASEREFWDAQINRVEAANKSGVKAP
jgi:hypothetical protein